MSEASVEVWVLHSPYPNGTWRGDEKCCCMEDGGGPNLFLSKQAALDFLEAKGLQDNHYVPVQCILITPDVGGLLKPVSLQSTVISVIKKWFDRNRTAIGCAREED